MVSSKPIALMMMIATLVAVSVDAEGFFSRRRNQKHQQNYQRPLNSNFRQRLGTQGNGGNSYMTSARDLQQPQLSGSNRDSATSSYAAAAAPVYDDLVEAPANTYPASYDHGGSNGGAINPLSALVAPLAALALLGAAAAVASNPVLLTIAVLDRKRRDLEQVGRGALTPELESKLEEMETLEKFITKVPEQEKQQEKLMATYLSCSGFTETSNSCLDRVVCDYSVQPGKMNELERDVISIVLFNIMSNGYVSQEFKERLRTAAQYGRSRGHCSAYPCDQLNQKQ